LRPWLLAAACVGGCATATPPPEAVDWALERSNGGARMTAADADGPLLQLSCSGGGLAVQAYRFTPLSGDQPLLFGTPDAPMAFTVDRTAAGPGVVAAESRPYPLLISFLSEGAVSAVYGDQTIGPLALSGDQADAFAAACVEPA
jgi:hypothetical protein